MTNSEHQRDTHIAFLEARCIVRGDAHSVLRHLKERFDEGRAEGILIFEMESGRQLEWDLRGELQEVLVRAIPALQRGPGRPRLGVKSREVTLLPRHWEWLEQQPAGISAALRRLVEQALKNQPGHERGRRIRGALSNFLFALAGNRPNYEEACRALFADDVQRFKDLIKRWPKDIRQYAEEQIDRARAAESADEPGAAG